MNLRDYYNQPQLMSLTGLDHRQKVKRWLAQVASEGYPIEVRYVCRKPLYNRADVDVNLARMVDGNYLLKWELAAKKFDMRQYDVDLDEWLPLCEAIKIWPYHDKDIYKHCRTTTSLVAIRTKQVRWQGVADEWLLFSKADILRTIAMKQGKEYEPNIKI